METKVLFFENASAQYTDEVLSLVKQRATELGIKSIVIASNSGNTAVKAVNALKGFNVIVVSLATGSREPNLQVFTEENRKIVERAGGKVLTTGHAFGGVSAAMRDKFNTLQIGDIIANTLRIFGQGMKVACEIALMAADAGLVRSNEPAISIAGTGKTGGADTAIVISPVNSIRFFDLKVHEIICKPRL